MDELEDRDLADALRRRADALTATVVDTETALGVVRQRSRHRRAWRVTATGALAAAAAAVGVLAVTSVVDDDELVRTPATEPAAATRPATIVATTSAPSTSAAPSPSAAPSTSAAPSMSVATTAPAATAARPADPSTTNYDSVGGSIVVAVVDGVISLADEPMPAPGFSTRIDDDGPDRVRVRFEQGDQRSEIRIDIEDGALVPTITED